MGVEYFIVKPDKKEIFYLGKHVEPLDCMNVFSADYIKVDNFSEFFLDVIESNNGFLGEYYTYRDVTDFAYLLYTWCDSPVYFSSDTSPAYEEFRNYKETGSIIDFCTEHEPLACKLEALLENCCSVSDIRDCVNAYISK